MKGFKSKPSMNPDTPPLIDTVDTTHPDEVLAWRVEAFIAMGFSVFVADFLASTRIDLHQMAHLIADGCPHDVACEILMGTMYSGEDEQWRFTDETSYLDDNVPDPEPSHAESDPSPAPS